MSGQPITINVQIEEELTAGGFSKKKFDEDKYICKFNLNKQKFVELFQNKNENLQISLLQFFENDVISNDFANQIASKVTSVFTDLNANSDELKLMTNSKQQGDFPLYFINNKTIYNNVLSYQHISKAFQNLENETQDFWEEITSGTSVSIQGSLQTISNQFIDGPANNYPKGWMPLVVHFIYNDA